VAFPPAPPYGGLSVLTTRKNGVSHFLPRPFSNRRQFFPEPPSILNETPPTQDLQLEGTAIFLEKSLPPCTILSPGAPATPFSDRNNNAIYIRVWRASSYSLPRLSIPSTRSPPGKGAKRLSSITFKFPADFLRRFRGTLFFRGLLVGEVS